MANKKTLYYLRQCRISRKLNEYTVASKTTWLPEKFCEVGRTITLKDEDHRNVWTVNDVSDNSISSDKIEFADQGI